MYFIEAEISGVMKPITDHEGNTIKFQTSEKAWQFLYNVFKYPEIFIAGQLTKTSEIKSLGVKNDKS